MEALLHLLADASPIGVIALLAYIVYLLIVQKREGDQRHEIVTSNHLHELPAIAESLRRMEALQQTMNENIVYIKARVNGKP